MLKERHYDKAQAAIISELIIKYLFSGIYYVEKLPKLIFEIINQAIFNPHDKQVSVLSKAFIEIDNKSDTVIHVVSELALNYLYTKQELNINKLVYSYFIRVDKKTISKIEEKINYRIGQTNGN